MGTILAPVAWDFGTQASVGESPHAGTQFICIIEDIGKKNTGVVRRSFFPPFPKIELPALPIPIRECKLGRQ